MSPCFTTLFSTIPAPYLICLWQKQQCQMQQVLTQLSQQQNVQSKKTQPSRGRQLSSEPSVHNDLIQKLNQMVADKEAKIKELEEEIQQLSVKVKSK